MKFIAGIFIVVLLVCTSVSAQDSDNYDVILVDGNRQLTQSMVDRLIGFYEQTLGTEFAAWERSEFQSGLVEKWTNGDCREIQAVSYVFEFERKLDHLDEAARQQAQSLLKERFLKELEKTESNRINALLLASYRPKHGKIDSLTAFVKK